MLNMMRADAYRLFHSKGFYITQIFMILVATINILTASLFMIGGNDGLSTFQDANQKLTWTGVQCVKAMTSEASMLIYFLLPLFIMTIGFEFSRQIYKNPVSSGMSRLNYFVSKYLVFVIVAFSQFVFYYFFVFIAGGIKNGFGHASGTFVSKFAGTIGIQFVEINAIFAITVLVMYLFFSTITAVVTTIILPMILTVVIDILYKHEWLHKFSFQNNIDNAYFATYSNSALFQLILAGLGTIAVCTILAYLTFRKRDL